MKEVTCNYNTKQNGCPLQVGMSLRGQPTPWQKLECTEPRMSLSKKLWNFNTPLTPALQCLMMPKEPCILYTGFLPMDLMKSNATGSNCSNTMKSLRRTYPWQTDTILFRRLCEDAGVDDPGLTDLLINGVQLTGQAEETGQFESLVVEPTMDNVQLIKSSRWTRKKILSGNNRGCTQDVRTHIWQEALKEVLAEFAVFGGDPWDHAGTKVHCFQAIWTGSIW